MLTSAKGLGGGFPVGAMMAKEEYARSGPGNHGSTFGGNPLAMAAVKAVLGVVDDPAFLEEVRVKGTILKSALGKLAEQVPGAEVRGEGLLLGVDLGARGRAPGLRALPPERAARQPRRGERPSVSRRPSP